MWFQSLTVPRPLGRMQVTVPDTQDWNDTSCTQCPQRLTDSLFLVVRSTAHFRTNWWCTALHNSEQTLVHSTAHFRTNSGTQHCPLQNKQTNYLCPNTALEQTHTDVQTKPKVSGELSSIPAAEGLYLHWRVSSLPTLWTSGTGCVNPERETHRRNPITTA